MVARSGVYRACIVIIGALLLTGGSVSLAAADDAKICAEESGDVAIAACTRAIKSGKYRGHQLAIKFLNRGVEWKLKKEYDRAMADYAEAVRLDANYADAFYDRCIIDNIKEDYDRALSECSRAIKIGASADALEATGGVAVIPISRRRITTTPLRILTTPSAFIPRTPERSTTGALPIRRKATRRAPIPILIRPRSSTRNSPIEEKWSKLADGDASLLLARSDDPCAIRPYPLHGVSHRLLLPPLVWR
jgi:tetratricopeptide (TPR) repeat protein